ncbi:hypothetical protein, partial [Lactobacillus equicursoris]
QNGQLVSQVKDEAADEKQVYQIYYDFTADLTKVAQHQYLAINRGENEGILKVKMMVDDQVITNRISQDL